MIYLDRFQLEEGETETGRIYVVMDREFDVLVAYSTNKEEMIGYKQLREYELTRKELPPGKDKPAKQEPT